VISFSAVHRNFTEMAVEKQIKYHEKEITRRYGCAMADSAVTELYMADEDTTRLSTALTR
jgi:hypothetical protein